VQHNNPVILPEDVVDRMRGYGFIEHIGDRNGLPVYRTTKAGRREIRKADRRRMIEIVRYAFWSTPGDRMLTTITVSLGLLLLIISLLAKKVGL